MNCELCGSNLRGEPLAVNIDGGVFRVCGTCSHLGTPARVPGRPGRSFSRPNGGYGYPRPPRSSAPRPFVKPAPRPPPASSFEEQQVELTADYPKRIKAAREMNGLSQEELGMKINEKPSVIHHLETGSMKPSDALARKLEHYLKIQLFIPSEEIDNQE